MQQSFVEMLEEGGKSNSLGRVGEVIDLVLRDKSLMEELYDCLFSDNAWVRMRAIDALEKVCRVHPEWLNPYIDRLSNDLLNSNQASIQWHMAQIYQQIELSPPQKKIAINWLEKLLATTEVDWIAASYAMDALAKFAKQGDYPADELLKLLNTQTKHHSKSVVKRARIMINEILAE